MSKSIPSIDIFNAAYSNDDTQLSDYYDNDGQIGMLHFKGADYDKVLAVEERTPKRVWAMVSDEAGELILKSGFKQEEPIDHFLITAEECKTEGEQYILDVFLS